MAKEKEIIEKVEEVKKDDFIVRDIAEIRPQELPLVVELPKDASEAQIAYAKTLNAYAYQNREKWELKKDELIAKLRELKNAPAPQPSGLKINGSSL